MDIKKHNKIISTKEWWLVVSIVMVTVLAYNANFLLVFFSEQYGLFTGIVGIARIDFHVYYSMIEQVRQGAWLVDNLYTGELGGVGLLHPLWLVLGWLARFMSLDAITVFHSARLVAGIAALLFGYYVSILFFTETKWRIITLLGFGWFGGWGRLVTLGYNQDLADPGKYHALFPVDLWFNEAFVWLTLNHSALFIITQLLLMGAWVLLFTTKRIHPWAAGLLVLLLGFMHPYDIPVFWAVVIVTLAVLWFCDKEIVCEYMLRLVPSCIATVILVGYYGVLLYHTASLAGWFEQNITLPPSFFGMLTGYGWLWLTSVMGLVVLFKKHTATMRPHIAWLIAWFITLPILIYAPVNFSRRFIQTFGFVIIVMSVVGLRWWWEQYGKVLWQAKTQPIFAMGIMVVVLMTIFTPLYQVLANIDEVRAAVRPAYITSEEREALGYITTIPDEAIVFADPFFSYMIPGYTARRVYAGHPHQTVLYEEKMRYVTMIYAPGWHEWKQQFIEASASTHFVWRTDRLDEIDAPWSMVFSNALITIFKVTSDEKHYIH